MAIGLLRRPRALMLGAVALLSLCLALFGVVTPAHAATPQENMAALNKNLDDAMQRLEAGDVSGAKAAFQKYDNGWFEIEDGVKAASKQTYKDIETAMGDVKFAFGQQTFDKAATLSALQALDVVGDTFINGSTSTTDSGASKLTVSAVAGNLDTALAAISAKDAAAATAAMQAFQKQWPDVESGIAAKSMTVYSRTEGRITEVRTLLAATPPNFESARQTVTAMKDDLAPYIGGTHYGILDAVLILLREGLEAMLVVVALLAFLNRSGNRSKRHIIWWGAGIGLAASFAMALLIQLVFNAVMTGNNRELIEGFTGVIAAVMLFSVSYWLHSKSNVGAWQKYIKDRSTRALASGSLFSLGLLAFLAVFREGAETTLFYVGIAPDIALGDLLLGIGIAAAVLAILGVLMTVVGLRIPLRPFFLVMSILIYYLGFKFVGMGIHSLQAGNVVSAHPVAWLPSNDLLQFFGIFPTWETLMAQAVVLVGAVGVWLWLRRHTDTTQPAKVSATAA